MHCSGVSWHLAFAVFSVLCTNVSGQAVNSCRCKGADHSQGECGFHFHFSSNEDEPWCRTVNGCGTSSIKGSWFHCDLRGVERRYADDGNLYTAKDFRSHYGKGAAGADKWKAAKDYSERRVAKDGWAYSASDLRAHYVDSWGEQGWVDLWESATAERRKAADEKWYSFEDFVKHDPASGWKQWVDAAGSSGLAVPVNGVKPAKVPEGCQCLGKESTNGHCGFHFHFGSFEDTPWCRTASSCGEKSIKGSWAYCAHDAVERRRLMSEEPKGSLHTAKDLRKRDPKRGDRIWKEASKFVERRMAGGQAYTVHEFRKYYVDALGEKGWLEKWKSANAEQRKANDGQWYTWEEFANFYGDKAAQMWESSHDEL